MDARSSFGMTFAKEWPAWCAMAAVRFRRTAAARRQAETLLERPVFGIKRPLSNAWGIRGSCGRDVPIERRRGHAEAVRDLGHADVGIGQQRLGGRDRAAIQRTETLDRFEPLWLTTFTTNLLRGPAGADQPCKGNGARDLCCPSLIYAGAKYIGIA